MIVYLRDGLVTQPVSAAALPLPLGASTEATLAGIKTGTDRIPTSPAQSGQLPADLKRNKLDVNNTELAEEMALLYREMRVIRYILMEAFRVAISEQEVNELAQSR